MAREYRKRFGVAYRELQQTAEDLQHVLDQGEKRLTPEEIQWRRDAIRDIKKILNGIGATLDEFEKIAPPAVRTEPPKDKPINH